MIKKVINELRYFLFNFQKNYKKKIDKLEYKRLISNSLYLNNILLKDCTNLNARINLVKNLENLNNHSSALYHLNILHDLDKKNEEIIEMIVINLLKMNDIFEAYKWFLLIKNLKRKAKLYKLNEFRKLFSKNNFSRFNKIFHYFGKRNNILPFWNNISKKFDYRSINVEICKIFFVEFSYEHLFLNFLEDTGSLNSVVNIVSERCLYEFDPKISKKIKKINFDKKNFSMYFGNFMPFLSRNNNYFLYIFKND